MSEVTTSRTGIRPGADGQVPAHPRRWLALAVILAVECMDLLDGTIVVVASPVLQRDLGASPSALQWVTGGYALAFAIGLVTGGRLGDIYGRRRLFLAGLAGFTTASALCALAQTPGQLIGFRLLQGLCAAAMIPQGFGIIRTAFPPAERQKAFSLFGPVIGGSAVLGPVLGGLLADADLFGTGWRLIFLVNLPVGVAALVAGARLIPESRAADRPTLDVVGVVLVTLASGLLIYPLIQGREHGWPAWTYGSMLASAVVLAAFVAHERRREHAGLSPLVPPSLFRRREFSAGLATALVFFAGMVGLMLTFSLYLQLGQGYSAVRAGLGMVAWSLGTAVGAGVGAGVLGPRFGRRVLHGGIVVMAIGVAGMLAVVHGAQAGVGIWALALPQLLAGAGMGAMLAPLFGFVLAAVDDDEVGSASGVLNAVQQLAGAIGVAALGTLFFSVAQTSGLVTAFERVLVVQIASLALVAALVALLPMQARADGDPLG